MKGVRGGIWRTREERERRGWKEFREAAQSRRSTWRRVDHGSELGWNNERKKNCARRGGRGSEAGARDWKMIGSGTSLNAARWFAEVSGRSTTSKETRQNAQCCGWGGSFRDSFHVNHEVLRRVRRNIEVHKKGERWGWVGGKVQLAVGDRQPSHCRFDEYVME